MKSAREITAALNGRWAGTKGVARCPAHDDHNPSLIISDGKGGLRVHCFANCDWRAVKSELARRGYIDDGPSAIQPLSDAERRDIEAAGQRERERKADAARMIWRASRDAVGTIVETYLAGRGIMIPIPPSIRYHAGLRHPDIGQLLPAMVAGIQRWPDRQVCAVHRTFLKLDGRAKAPLSRPRMMLGAVAEAGVRLAPLGDELALAEGIETALSIQQATGLSTWATLSTSGLKRVVVPDHVKAIAIFADGDDAGERAATETADRLSRDGKRVRIVRPGTGQDFNDVLKVKASA